MIIDILNVTTVDQILGFLFLKSPNNKSHNTA